MSPRMFTPAVKARLFARVAIDGPTGSGKTWTALQLARILVPVGPIGHIDTENRSAAYYAPTPGQPIERHQPWDPPYEFGHLDWRPPYSPIDLTRAIADAAAELGETADHPAGCLIIDSLSHFWEGEGGTLELVDNAAARIQGNRFAGWKEGTPAQRAMLDAIIFAPFHVIVCMRSAMEYVQETEVDSDGRKSTKVRKIGMKPKQRDGVEYEFTVVADMDLEHRLTITKTRCSLLDGVVATKGRSAEVWQRFAGWLDSGVERITTEQAEALVAAMNTLENERDRIVLKTDFRNTFGNPAEITTDRVPEVLGWLRERLGDTAATPPAAPPPPADTPPPAAAPAEPPAGSTLARLTGQLEETITDRPAPAPAAAERPASAPTSARRSRTRPPRHGDSGGSGTGQRDARATATGATHAAASDDPPPYPGTMTAEELARAEDDADAAWVADAQAAPDWQPGDELDPAIDRGPLFADDASS